MDQIKVGKFIAELRKEKNLTQEELAELLGVSSKSVSRWENGKNLPDAALYQPLCQALGVNLTELLSGERIGAEELTEKAEEKVLSVLEFAKQKIRSVNKRFLITLAVCVLLVAGLFVTLDKTVFAPAPWHEGDVSRWQDRLPPKTAYKLALNDEEMPVFVDPAKAIREARKDLPRLFGRSGGKTACCRCLCAGSTTIHTECTAGRRSPAMSCWICSASGCRNSSIFMKTAFDARETA